MVNRENCRLLAEAFATQKLAKEGTLGYNQTTFIPYSDVPDYSGHACGTSACVAGWAVALFDGNRKYVRMTPNEIQERAAELLGLSDEQSENLFSDPEPVDSCEDQEVATCVVATILDGAAQTGRVMSWKTAEKKVLEAREKKRGR